MQAYSHVFGAIAGFIIGALSLCFDGLAEHLVLLLYLLILNFRFSRVWLVLKAQLGPRVRHFAHFVYFASNAVEVGVDAHHTLVGLGMLHLFFL